jgi:hypothetical protein
MQYYTKKEVYDLCSPLKGSARSKQIGHIITEKLVPTKRTQVYNMLKTAQDKGEAPSPPLLEISDLKLVAENMKQTSGRTAGNKEIQNAIIQSRCDKASRQGFVPITETIACPARTTISNYKGLLASHSEVSVVREAVPKTQTRYTAENSWMSSVCFMVLVAATHFIPMTTQTGLYEEQQKKLKDASAGANELFTLVLKANSDRPILAIKPAYIYSTDDTTTYVCQGEQRTKEDFLLVGTSLILNAGTRSKYQASDSNAMQGLRVKLTFTFSQAGLVADTFVSIVGLTDQELPKEACPSGFLAIDVKRLGIGGAGVTVGEQKTGWVLFI